MPTLAGLPPTNSLKVRPKLKSPPLPAHTLYQTHSQKRALVPFSTTSALQLLSIHEPNGQDVYTPSSTNNNADHAGLSVPPRLFPTDTVSRNKLTLYSAHNGSSAATVETWDVMVDGFQSPGATSKATVSQPKHVPHTPQEVETPEPAQAPVLTAVHQPSTRPITSDLSQALLLSKPKS